MSMYLGDFPEDGEVNFKWNTAGVDGASITRAVNGVIYIYKMDEDDSEVTTGRTDTEDFDGETGIHHCNIDLSDAFYETGKDYQVVLKDAVIDEKAVSVVLAHFSIENRSTKVDVVAVSGDTVAADNLELQYDGTGLSGETFPATQAQIGQLALTGAALNTPAKNSPDGFDITWGENEANDEDSTHAADGTYHDLEAQDDSGTERIDAYYEFAIGGDGVPTSLTWEGYLVKGAGSTVNITVQAYNWGSTSWDQIGSIPSGTVNSIETFTLFTAHVGTDGNTGLVRIRFVTGSVSFASDTTLKTDQIYASYAIVRRSVGYEGGAIWVDTNASNTNTEDYVDGTADNPVSTWAAALTLSGSLGIIRFEIANGSSITLTGNSDNYTMHGTNWHLALGGQSIDGINVVGANVTGIGTNGSFAPEFSDCHFGDVTLPPCHLCTSGFEGTMIAGNAGTFFFDTCHSGVAGTNTPVFDFGSGLNASDVNVRRYSGGLEIENMGAGSGSYNMSLEGHGQLVINANCSATSLIAIRGHFTIIDNASGAVTLSDDARYAADQIFQPDTDKVTLNNTAHGGAAATITAKSVSVSNADGDAVSIVATGSNGDGVSLAGHGSGHGAAVVGGTNANGIKVEGGASSGAAIRAIGNGAGSYGVDIQGSVSGGGAGVHVDGGANSDAVELQGNTIGSGLHAQGGNNNGIGIEATGGAGSGAGIHAKGSAAGGAGAIIQGVLNSIGLTILGHGTGNGLGILGGASGAAISGNAEIAKFAAALATMLLAIVQASPSPTTTECDTNLTLENPDILVDRIILFRDGDNQYAQSVITASTTGGLLTYEEIPVVPVAADTIVIV